MSDLSRIAQVAAAGAALAAKGTEASAQTVPKLGPKSTGSPGPGDYNGGVPQYDGTAIGTEASFDTFGCNVFEQERIVTPDWATADVFFKRKVFMDGSLRLPDGSSVTHWGFEDLLKAPGKKSLPSPTIRVQEGDLVHVKLETRSNTHTIHLHGIEPTTMNDGVGHVSFEVDGSYIYQFQARHAGTFFYHCHKNTVLHFKMGMYGLLIVDPKPDSPGDTKVRAFKNGPYYDVEKFWVLDDLDPTWRDREHNAGLCGDDAGLNVYKPKYFLLTGTPTLPNAPCDAHKATVGRGQKLLIRLLNASYSVARITIKGFEAQVISVDGHALNKPWNRAHVIKAGTPFELSTAQRYDILIDTNAPANQLVSGTYPVEIEYLDWITRRRHNLGDPMHAGYAYTTITV